MNTLYYGDNLDILRRFIPDESVDLIYLDPPFNSKRAYNQIFKDKEGKYPPSQIRAFDDTWKWGDETEIVLNELQKSEYPPQLLNTLDSFRKFLGQSDMMAYLVMMTIRLWELRRVLKNTGSIYLHCDPTASHYLKVVMDQIFGVKNFRNEIVWHYFMGGKSKKEFAHKHDIILFYSKNKKWIFYPQKKKRRLDFKPSLIDESKDAKVGKDEFGYYSTVTMDDVWDIKGVFNLSKEYLGYPTQKPLKLLERIIKASSNEGDVVLDPFCGCGTAIVAAEKLGRKWIGIDITILAINLIEKRIKEQFPDVKYEINGIPKDVASARKMCETREGKFRFEQWFIITLGGQPYKSKGGADAGIDGFMYFKDIDGNLHRVIVQVKGGHYNRENIAALKSVVEREKASLGLMLVLDNPTKVSIAEAASAGRFQMPGVSRTYPKVQIFTVEDYFNGIRPDLPDTSETLKKAKQEVREQPKLDL